MPDLIAALPTWKSPRSEAPRLSADVIPRERVTPSGARWGERAGVAAGWEGGVRGTSVRPLR